MTHYKNLFGSFNKSEKASDANYALHKTAKRTIQCSASAIENEANTSKSESIPVSIRRYMIVGERHMGRHRDGWL